MATKPKLKKKSNASSSSSSSSGSSSNSSRSNSSRGARSTLMDTAQQVWMAGMGAFGRAQEEGSKLFETLVREGQTLEQKTRTFAAGGATQARDAVESTVTQVRERAQDTWDKLDRVFQDRVSRSLNRLGVPGREEMQALIDRVDELNRQVRNLNAQKASGRTTTSGASRKSASGSTGSNGGSTSGTQSGGRGRRSGRTTG